MLDVSGVKARIAGAPEIDDFLDTWVHEHVMNVATDPKCTYRLFAWDRIIETFGTIAAVDSDGALEGLMAVSVTPTELKVEYLATAPRNFGPAKRRKGVGPALLALAVELSNANGCGGTVLLSSTPESESFYESIGCQRTGKRDHEGLAQFILFSDASAQFLLRFDPLPMEEEV